MNRRTFLRILASIPLLGAAALFVSPFLRYMRPTLGPLAKSGVELEGDEWWNPASWRSNDKGLVKSPDQPKAVKEIAFDLSDFKGDWDYKEFTFSLASREYTYSKEQITKIPGFAVRLPEKREDGNPDFHLVSRICPHMGCVFNYLKDFKEAANYNYPQATHPLFACPCHLSVFDPLQYQDIGSEELRGKVVSGPAPRPPRGFQWEIAHGKLLIKDAEKGGIA